MAIGSTDDTHSRCGALIIICTGISVSNAKEYNMYIHVHYYMYTAELD